RKRRWRSFVASYLKEPLGPEEIGPGHARMSTSKTDGSSATDDEILLVPQVDHIETEEHFLAMPRQWDRMSDRRIVHGIGILMRRICLCALLGRSQSRAIEHLSGNVRAVPEPVAEDRRTRHQLRMVAKDTA